MKHKRLADTENSIIHEFLEGPLTFVDAVERLMALGISEPDADRLLGEAAHWHEPDFNIGA